MERLTLMATVTTKKKLDAATLCREPPLSKQRGPIAHADGHDLPGLIDELVPCVATVVDDVVEGFEDAV